MWNIFCSYLKKALKKKKLDEVKQKIERAANAAICGYL
jgi:hypothetical protein